MTHEYRGQTLRSALSKSFASERTRRRTCLERPARALEGKNLFDVWAPPLFWGPWIEIFFGVNISQPVEKLVTYESLSDAPSSFDIEIEGGGGQSVHDIGPGSSLIVTPGNSYTVLNFRARSHSVGQIVRVTVQ